MTKLYNCDRCGKDIGLNEGYVYNVEMLKKDIKTQQDSITIAKSTLLMVFCSKCGNQHQSSSIADALKLKSASFARIDQKESADNEAQSESDERSPNIKLSNN